MQRRYNLAHLILASVIILVLTLLMVCVDAQARIAFVSDRNGNYEVYVMGINGKNQRRLTNNRRNNWHPSWSPDGKRIAFVSTRDENRQIYVMDADGKNQRRLSNDPFFDDWNPSWSPDGKRIVFVSDRAGNSEIYVINAGGAWQPRNLTDNVHDDTDPAWFNPVFAVAPTGKKFTMWGWLKQVDR